MWTVDSAILQSSLLSPLSSLLSLSAGHGLAEVVSAGSGPPGDHQRSSSVTQSSGGHGTRVGHLTQGLGTQSWLLVHIFQGEDLLVDVGLGSDLLVHVGHDLGGSHGRGNDSEKDLEEHG